MCPVLIQDAREDPVFAAHPGVRLGLTRYLGVPVHNAEGASIGTLCFMDHRSTERLEERDIRFLSVLAMRVSAELQRERLMEQRVEAARAAAEQLAGLNAQLLRAAREKRRFVAAVIHDLRQPIATAGTLLYVVRRERNAEERERSLQMLESRIQALGGMVDELLEYAQIDAGEITWRGETLDLAETLAACAQDARPEAEARGVRLVLELDADLGSFEADRAQLCRVARNLLSNSIKFTAIARDGAEPAVRLRARRGRRAWVLEVEDNGIGMSRAVLRRIFEESYRAPETTEREERAGLPRGRGLGLAIVKRLCAVMNARITVRSKVGEGTRFRIQFPLPA